MLRTTRTSKSSEVSIRNSCLPGASAGEYLGIDVTVPAFVAEGTDYNDIRKKRDVICLIKILYLGITYRARTGDNSPH